MQYVLTREIDTGPVIVEQVSPIPGVALDGSAIALDGLFGDRLLDAFVFAGDDGAVRDVWSAGRHLVKEGRHVARDALEPAFRAALTRLRGLL